MRREGGGEWKVDEKVGVGEGKVNEEGLVGEGRSRRREGG